MDEEGREHGSEDQERGADHESHEKLDSDLEGIGVRGQEIQGLALAELVEGRGA